MTIIEEIKTNVKEISDDIKKDLDLAKTIIKEFWVLHEEIKDVIKEIRTEIKPKIKSEIKNIKNDLKKNK